MKRKIRKIATLLLCLSIAADGMMSTLVSNASASNQYLTNGNVLGSSNAGFEGSTEVTNTPSKSWIAITDSWTTGWSDANNVWSLEEADTHSGTKALRLTQTFSSGSSTNTTLYSGYNLITDVAPQGRMKLEANTEYMISYWAKGTAQAQIVARVYKVTDGVSATANADRTETKTGWKSLGDEWTLITHKATTNELGEMVWFMQFNATESGQYAIVDDVAVQKVADAVDSVEAMIDRFDVTGVNAARTKDDIEQWCAAIGSESISNYADFENKVTPNQYLTNGNVHSGSNAGFEGSTEVTNTSGKSWITITDGWTTGWSDSNNVWSLEEADTHSGTKAFKLTQNSTGNTTLYSEYSLITDVDPKGRMKLEANTEYMISYWAKGNAQTQIVARVYKVTDGVSATANADRTETKTGWKSLGDEWTLMTHKATTNELGEMVWFMQFNATESGQYAIVDDVAVQKVDATADSVEMMIEALDTSKAGADRAIADIRQWCNVLDSRNIVNYGKFLSKTMENVDPLIEEWSVEEYRNLNGALPSPKTETENEYIFTGWFTSADVTTEENMKQYALKDKAGLNSESKVYARFVGATMLDVKAQLSVNKDSNSETRNIRFVTTIDNLAYQKIGFRITMNGHTKDTANNKVYTTLSATYSDGEQKIFRPDFFHKNSAYFKAATIPNIPERLFDAIIEVTPYIVTLDGTTVEGLTVTKTVNQGIAATAAD